jgi:hypothetical protein
MHGNNLLPVDRSNTVGDLAARITAEHEQAGDATRSALTHAITAGELLTEAKDRVGHGRWENWLKKTCNIPARTASRYMLLAEHREVIESKSATVADLTINAALRLLQPKKSKTAAEPKQTRPAASPEPKPPTGNPGKRVTHVDLIEAWLAASPDDRTKAIDGIGLKPLLASLPRNWIPLIGELLDLTPKAAIPLIGELLDLTPEAANQSLLAPTLLLALPETAKTKDKRRLGNTLFQIQESTGNNEGMPIPVLSREEKDEAIAVVETSMRDLHDLRARLNDDHTGGERMELAAVPISADLSIPKFLRREIAPC